MQPGQIHSGVLDPMPRGHRRIVFAAVGFLTLTGEHPNPSTKAEQAQAGQTIANSLSDIAPTNYDLAKRTESSPESDPCGPNQYQSNADLCAQWKAADASADSAWWAAFAGWFGGLSFLGVLAAIGLAFHSNRIARDTARHQLRAYVGIVDFHARFEDALDTETHRKYVFTAIFRNFGQTTALDTQVTCGFRYASNDPHNRYRSEWRDGDGQCYGPIAPDAEIKVLRFESLEREREVPNFESSFSHPAWGVIAFGNVTYTDTFGRKQVFKFAYRADGDGLKIDNWVPIPGECETT